MRISMSSLYLGTGKLEQYLVERLDNKLESNKFIKMNILLDFMRGTRINPKDNSSSLSLLSKLKEKHLQRNVRLGFWHNPDTGLLKGKYASGPMKEIFGVHHIKAYVFDHNVVITGYVISYFIKFRANLSEDYFTDRQDRCYVIQDCEPLANYFDDLISSITDLSYNVNESGDIKILPQYAEPLKNTRKYKNQMAHHLKFFRFNNRTIIPTNKVKRTISQYLQDLSIDEYFAEDYEKSQNTEDTPLLESKMKPFKHKESAFNSPPPSQNNSQDSGSLYGEEQVLIDSTDLPDTYILNKIVESAKHINHNKDPKGSGRVFIFPTLQMNTIGYREDEQLFLELLKYYANEENDLHSIKLATGYFNLQDEILKVLDKNQNLKVDFLTSSPRANGFYKAGRVKKHIPGMYRANEYNILKSNAGKGNLRMFEYENGEWTYHAKGAWFYEKSQPELPQMTIIGSSNYSYRSNRRDTECQLYIVSESDEFKQKMHDECQHLYKNSKQVDVKHVLNDGTDKLTWTETMLNRFLKSFL